MRNEYKASIALMKIVLLFYWAVKMAENSRVSAFSLSIGDDSLRDTVIMHIVPQWARNTQPQAKQHGEYFLSLEDISFIILLLARLIFFFFVHHAVFLIWVFLKHNFCNLAYMEMQDQIHSVSVWNRFLKGWSLH